VNLRLLSKLAGERYGLAFKRSYLSLAPEEALAQQLGEGRPGME